MSINATRTHLGGLHGGTVGSNLGLFFQRYVPRVDLPGEKGKEHDAFLNHLVSSLPQGSLGPYLSALGRWRAVSESDPETEVFEMRTSSPLLCGMGNKNALEIGATFMPPYGVPYVPGAAIKGVASAFSERYGGDDWRKTVAGRVDGGDFSVAVFGGVQKSRGFSAAIDILDAWWVPRNGSAQSPFQKDILTPHQKSYYANRGYPDGTDSPNPVTFLALKPGETFLFAVRGDARLRVLAKAIIREALATVGLGGKTRSGYGRFDYIESDSDKLDAIRNATTAPQLQNLLERVSGEWHRKSPFVTACAKALERIPYSREVDTFFKHARPWVWLLENVRARQPKTFTDLNNIKRECRGCKILPSTRSAPEVQDLFRQCVRLLPRAEIKDWLLEIAYTWDTLLAGRSADDILNIVSEPDPWLVQADAAVTIRDNPNLSDADKQSLIEAIL